MIGPSSYSPAWWRGAVACLALALIYNAVSHVRQAAHPGDRLVPSLVQLIEEAARSATHGSHGANLWSDTWPSLWRYGAGLGAAAILAGGLILIGALSRTLAEFLHPVVLLLAKAPPVVFLPMLLLWAGVNDTSKWLFLMLALTPPLYLFLNEALLRQRARQKALSDSLALPRWQQVLLVECPQLWPDFLSAIQTQLGPAWIFLLTAETAGANRGLGYRMFLVQRYLAMDTILVYAMWITLLSVVLYRVLTLLRTRVPWPSL